MNEKTVGFITTLITKTNSRSFIWKPSDEVEDQYILQMKSGTLILDKFPNDGSYKLVIINKNGAHIDLSSETNSLADNALLKKLYESAENSYLQIDETIDSLMDEINKG
jgi:hypothetical protein